MRRSGSVRERLEHAAALVAASLEGDAPMGILEDDLHGPEPTSNWIPTRTP